MNRIIQKRKKMQSWGFHNTNYLSSSSSISSVDIYWYTKLKNCKMGVENYGVSLEEMSDLMWSNGWPFLLSKRLCSFFSVVLAKKNLFLDVLGVFSQHFLLHLNSITSRINRENYNWYLYLFLFLSHISVSTVPRSCKKVTDLSNWSSRGIILKNIIAGASWHNAL